MTEADRFPWADSPEFERIMRAYERNHPLGPASSLTRRLIMWRLYNEPSPWPLPDDPLDPTEWIGQR